MRRWSSSSGALVVLVAVTLGQASAVWAHGHQDSKVRFVEPSAEAFDAARREGKPVFLLIAAGWCHWCRYFRRQVLEDAEVSQYLNGHYVSVFADHDTRADLVRKYVRGLPMIVLFGADGRVRQSFAGVLEKGDFLDIVRTVAASPPHGRERR